MGALKLKSLTDNYKDYNNNFNYTSQSSSWNDIGLMFHCGLFLSCLPQFDLKNWLQQEIKRHKHTPGCSRTHHTLTYTHIYHSVFHRLLSVAPFTQHTEDWKGYLLTCQSVVHAVKFHLHTEVLWHKTINYQRMFWKLLCWNLNYMWYGIMARNGTELQDGIHVCFKQVLIFFFSIWQC